MALVKDEARAVASFDGLDVEVAASFGVEDDDGGDALVESLHPVIGGGDVLAEHGGGGSISIL